MEPPPAAPGPADCQRRTDWPTTNRHSRTGTGWARNPSREPAAPHPGRPSQPYSDHPRRSGRWERSSPTATRSEPPRPEPVGPHWAGSPHRSTTVAPLEGWPVADYPSRPGLPGVPAWAFRHSLPTESTAGRIRSRAGRPGGRGPVRPATAARGPPANAQTGRPRRPPRLPGPGRAAPDASPSGFPQDRPREPRPPGHYAEGWYWGRRRWRPWAGASAAKPPPQVSHHWRENRRAVARRPVGSRTSKPARASPPSLPKSGNTTAGGASVPSPLRR